MPQLKLYEPPLDTGDGDEDVPEIPPETRSAKAVTSADAQAVFFVCLVIAGVISAAIWIVASWFVP